MTEIIICGHPEPIHFGIFSIKCYCREHNINFETLLNYQSQLDALDKVVALTTIGLNEGSRRNGSEERYTEFDVRDLFDDDVELFESKHPHCRGTLPPNRETRLAGKAEGGRESNPDQEIQIERESTPEPITYERWFALAVGQMGFSPEAFNAMTPAEFIYAWIGWRALEESRMRQSWEQHRWSTWILTTIQLDRKDRKAMTEMFPLPWEGSGSQTLLNEEPTMEERRERVNAILKPQQITDNETQQISPCDDHSPAPDDQ